VNFKEMAIGAIGGCIATVPMTIWMVAVHRALPAYERYPLPPRELTDEITERLKIENSRRDPALTAETYAAHFGMGTAAGMICGIINNQIEASPILKGMEYGLVVWGANYLGILPGLTLLRPASEHPPRRTALMIGSHLIWGMALGIITNTLTSAMPEEKRSQDSSAKTPSKRRSSK
jgi:uncharacterized membrane protein YagU involved in acid resistance